MWTYQDFGFIKRGLIGTILNLGYSEEALRVAGMVAFFAGLVLSMALTFWYCAHEKRNALRALFVFCPFLFLNFGFDFGRFDILLNALFLVVLALLARGHVLGCAAVAAVGALIHEVFLVAHVPSALLAAWLIVPPGERGRALGGIGGAALLTGLAIFMFGKHDGDVEQVLPLFGAFEIGDYYRTLMVLKRGIVDNLVYNYGWLEYLGIVNFIAHLVPLLIYGSLLVYYYRDVGARRRLFLAALSPLVLIVIAADLGRWVAFSLFLMFVLPAFLKARTDQRTAARFTPRPSAKGVNATALGTTAMLFLLGPPGVHYAWHFARLVLEAFFDIYTLPEFE
jgi:hypothetical protein